MSARLILSVLFQGIDRMSGPMRDIVGLGRRGSTSIRQLTGESRRLGSELADVRRQIQAGSGNMTELINRERALERQLGDTNQELRRQRRLLDIAADRQAMLNRAQDHRSRGASAVMSGAAMMLPLISATRQAMTFESAMADVRKVVDFPSPKVFAQMSDDVLDLSTRVPMAAEGIAAIVAAAGRANIPRKELLRFAEDAAKMGVAFDITGDEAGEMMAKWRTAFVMGQGDVTRLADQINALTNAGGGKAVEVSGIVTRIGALGKVAGVTAPQVAAMAQLLNSVGVEEEVAATGIKNMMLAMTKGSAATKGQANALKSLGLDATALGERMQVDAGGAITDLLGRIAKLPKAQQAGLLTELFGSESVGAIAPMLTNLDKLQGNLALVGDKARYAGSMQKEYLSAIATTEGATGLAWNALKALNITLGQHLLPTVMSASQEVVTIANRVRAWNKENPELSSWIVKIVTGLLALRVGLGAAQFGFGLLLGPIAKAIPYFRRVEGVSAFGRHLGMFGRAATKAGALAMRGFGVIRIAAMFLARGVMQAGMLMLANPLVAGITIAVVALAAAAYLIYTNWDRIKKAFGAGWAYVKNLFTGLPGWAKVLMMLNPVGLAIAVAANWERIKAGFANGIASVKAWFGSMPAWMAGVGRNLMQGLLAAINPLALAARLIEVARNGLTAFKKYFGIQSPSRVFMAMGGHLTSGLERGIESTRHRPVRAIGRMGTAVTAAGALSLTPMQAAARPGAAMAAPAGGFGNIELHVHPAPGMNVDELVDKALRALRREMARQGRSEFKDR